jgi:hypothetical protein
VDYTLLDNGKVRLKFAAAKCMECFYLMVQSNSRAMIKQARYCPFASFDTGYSVHFMDSQMLQTTIKGGMVTVDAAVNGQSRYLAVLAVEQESLAAYSLVQLSGEWKALEQTMAVLKIALCVMTLACIYMTFCRAKQYVRIREEEEQELERIQ